MAAEVFDLFIIGGGVNGTAIARDAVGRGLKVFLAEQHDLAAGTSSASSKLIHGGLRYLEFYEFRLVREALIEREVLLNAAAHIIWPLRFVLPNGMSGRPDWMVRLGLFLYDNLGGRKILPATRKLDLSRDAAGAALKPRFTSAFEYSDCWVDDARLVALNAVDAAEKGAVIATQTKCVSARREDGIWNVKISRADKTRHVKSRALVNAAGPWAGKALQGIAEHGAPVALRLVKGSHIVVDRLYDHDRCYTFQNADGRIMFAIPYEGRFTLIGTTDLDWSGNLDAPKISAAETDYLLASASAYFRKAVTRNMVRWSYAGVRSLYDDGATKAQEATRDYVLRLDGAPPCLTVIGGKITTSRKLAEAVMHKLRPFFPALKDDWTASAKLPGGMDHAAVAPYVQEQIARHPYLPRDQVLRLFRTYGRRMEQVLSGVKKPADLGRSFGPLLAREVDYLRAHEFAVTADDILWRRTKMGLHLKPADIKALEAHLRRKK